MNKRIFVFLIVLMGFALIGIITVQIFWIRSTIEMREQQFTTSVKFAFCFGEDTWNFLVCIVNL